MTECRVGNRGSHFGPWTIVIVLVAAGLAEAIVHGAAPGRTILAAGSEAGSARGAPAASGMGALSASSPGPSPRMDHAMVYDSVSDRILLFGGATSTGPSSDTWAYDLNANTWTNLRPASSPPARFAHGMAYDIQSDRVILFGGYPGLGDTWAYDSTTNTWTNMAPATAPAARWDHRMAYDAQSDRVILYGGHLIQGSTDTQYSDTWAYDYDTNTWTNLAPSPKPAAIGQFDLAYDAASDRIIHFGGKAPPTLADTNQTWTYDLETNTWVDQAPAVSPPARDEHAMVYDSESDRVILFGGSVLNDTWAYAPASNNWTQMSPRTKPSARLGHRMAYDSESDRAVLFGGGPDWLYPSTYTNETWAYDFNTNSWTRMDTYVPTRPSHRGLERMIYDSAAHRVVLYGGASDFYTIDLNDMWAYDVHMNEWTQLYPSTVPPLGLGEMAYDSQSDRSVFYYRLGQTWSYDLNSNTWTNMAPATEPPAPTGGRQGERMAYDIESDRIILFGGRVDASTTFFNDTWAYDVDTNTWSEMHPAVSPPARLYPGMAYDAAHDRIILFGGAVGDPRLNDTWAYDYNNDTWTPLSPVTSPSPRGSPGMAYDSATQRMILFGGVGPSPPDATDNETWSYDYASNLWTHLTPSESPGGRAWDSLIYDVPSGRAIMFGGGPVRGAAFTRETWSYDDAANAWTLVDGPAPPTASLSVSPGSPVAGQSITFDGSASRDADGSIVTFAWQFGDGSVASGATAQHAYASKGTYTVTLTVTDNDGLTAAVTQQVVVAPAPDTVKPSISIVSPADGATLSTQNVTVTGSASDDVGLSRVELSTDGVVWILATGSVSWSGILTLAEGANTIHARATDTSGNTANATASVTVVLPQSSPPPTSSPPPSLVLVGGLATVAVVGVVAGLVLWRRRRKRTGPPEPPAERGAP